MTGRNFDRDALFTAMAQAFAGNPAQKYMGRSSPARLARALGQAKRRALELPT